MKTIIIMLCAMARRNGRCRRQPKMSILVTRTYIVSYSFDAFLNNNHSADPDAAYRWRERPTCYTPL